jgi:hypothetical protein
MGCVPASLLVPALSACLIGVFAFEEPAAAQTSLPRCPSSEETVTVDAPRYVRDGGSLAIGVERDYDAAVDSVQVTYSADGPAETATETFTFEDEDELRIIRAVPPSRKSVSLHVRWVQDEGTPAACEGVDSFPAIPVIGKHAKAGNPGLARIEGRWAVRYGTGGKKGRTRWRLAPRCDVFGCRTRLRSAGGYRGLLKPRGARYEFRTRERTGTCIVTYVDGRTVRWPVLAYVRVTLRPTVVRDSVARRMTGSRVERYDAPADEFGICDTPRTTKERVRAVRL